LVGSATSSDVVLVGCEDGSIVGVGAKSLEQHWSFTIPQLRAQRPLTSHAVGTLPTSFPMLCP
jgi:hypothetical protein